MKRELTAKQELFLEYLFHDPECAYNTRLACEKAGYSSPEHAPLVRNLKDEILERSAEQLALQAPKAVSRLVNAMDEDKSIPGAELRLKAVEGVLDRVGISKKQQMELTTSEETSPIFFIPAKVDKVEVEK